MPRFELKGGWFVELERDGCVVRTCRGDHEQRRERTHTHDTEDAARYAYGRLIRSHVAMGWQPAGASRHLAAAPSEPAGSTILVDEYLAAGDDRFVPEVLRTAAAAKLAGLAERWYADRRPWARRALLAYIDDGCDRPAHKGLAKRLFKLAEAAGDDEAMAHFMVAFDRLGRRLLVKLHHHATELVLRGDPAVPARLTRGGKAIATSLVFSHATRRYLARRAYRYFRRIAHADLARYGRGMRTALALYRDDALDTPARLLDAWGLVHALYRHSPVIVRGAGGIRLADGAQLGALEPAPHVPGAWLGVFEDLLALAITAASRTVRRWTIAWLRAHYATDLAGLPVARVTSLIASHHDELQQLGAGLLPSAPGIETLPIGDWLALLEVENLEVLPVICEVVARHVTPARLTLAHCVALACARTAPVARLGLQWLRGKQVEGANDLHAITRLGKAGVASVRDDGTRWAAELVAAHPAAVPEHLRDLCDAPYADARGHALAAVAAAHQLSPPSLWFALTESPYDDVRAVVLRNATRWHDGAPAATLQHVWSSAMLAVHRGGHAKRRVPRQIAERIASHPDEAPALLPILRLALRSVRPAERATALAALVRAVRGDASLRALARELIPELEITEQVTS